MFSNRKSAKFIKKIFQAFSGDLARAMAYAKAGFTILRQSGSSTLVDAQFYYFMKELLSLIANNQFKKASELIWEIYGVDSIRHDIYLGKELKYFGPAIKYLSSYIENIQKVLRHSRGQAGDLGDKLANSLDQLERVLSKLEQYSRLKSRGSQDTELNDEIGKVEELGAELFGGLTPESTDECNCETKDTSAGGAEDTEETTTTTPSPTEGDDDDQSVASENTMDFESVLDPSEYLIEVAERVGLFSDTTNHLMKHFSDYTTEELAMKLSVNLGSITFLYDSIKEMIQNIQAGNRDYSFRRVTWLQSLFSKTATLLVNLLTSTLGSNDSSLNKLKQMGKSLQALIDNTDKNYDVGDID